ncbi:MAG: protein jag [Lachnospiraceae bacterium]|nr:protein jag [Lachnospiraceae bacterium]
MEYMEFKGKTKNDAITEACRHFSIPSDKLEYEIIDEGKTGFLGMGARPAVIKAKIREEEVHEAIDPVKLMDSPAIASVKAAAANIEDMDVEAVSKKFLADVFAAMGMSVEIHTAYNDSLKSLDVDLSGDEMGVLIGKRGQTLDSLQYLISLVVNKGTGEYIRVKVDTENYRQRRKETLENLAKNISYKVKRTRRPVSLEPMNPYERRIIHSALQNDRYVTTHSEGDEPFRRVVVTPKRENNYSENRGNRDYNRDGSRSYNRGYNNRSYNRGNRDYNKDSSRSYNKEHAENDLQMSEKE